MLEQSATTATRCLLELWSLSVGVDPKDKKLRGWLMGLVQSWGGALKAYSQRTQARDWQHPLSAAKTPGRLGITFPRRDCMTYIIPSKKPGKWEILVKRENQGSGQSTECITETQVSNQQRMIRTWTTKVSASTLLKKKGGLRSFWRRQGPLGPSRFGHATRQVVNS